VTETEILPQVAPQHVECGVARGPVGRVGRSEEVAALVAWPAPDEGAFGRGAVFDISGGRATYWPGAPAAGRT
jgi:3-oxoacyl-[acyl-carrier protein] reductase